MKKLLIILMVVAMASFLFVGCIPTTPDVDEDDEEPLPTPPPATVAPVITSVPDISGGYINKDAAADGIVVNGTAPTYSEVKVYINGLTAGTGDAGWNGVFQVVVAKADLIKAVKVDGAKTLYATATEAGLAESASSNVKTFTLDTVAPKISSSKAKAGTALAPLVPATATVTNGTLAPNEILTIVPPVGVLPVVSANVETGIWTIIAHGAGVISITDPNNDVIQYTGLVGGEVFANNPIPGVTFTIEPTGLNLVAPNWAEITCVAQVALVAAVPGYIDVTFDEVVTTASMLAGPWTAFGATVDLDPTVTVRSATKARLTETATFGTIPNLVTGVAYSVSVSDISDLAGNTISASAPSTDTGVVLP